MSIVRSNRAIRTALLVALGTVAWSPMAVAFQKAPPVAGAPSLAAKGFSIIYEFPQNVQNYSNGGVVLDRSGDLFGATYSGGANVSGDVYELTPSGGSYTFADIHDFNGTVDDGKYPAQGSPLLDAKGNLFVTATAGGAGNAGTAIKLSPSGSAYTESALYSFNTTNGGEPIGSLISS